jgi:hypothetical protein
MTDQPAPRPSEVRLAELVATLSLGTDMGLGQPMEHVIRQTMIALRMSELLGLDESDLAAEAARLYGLPEAEVVMLRRAGLVHDFGRLGVSNAIWDKRGRLTQAELERVRLHPYLSKRMLAFSPALARWAPSLSSTTSASMARVTRMGCRARRSLRVERSLARDDAYHAMTELRPYRPARSGDEAASQLRAEVVAGGLAGDAVNVEDEARAP